ncbi:hypothetical protein MCHIJ_40770 [Mycolicibacterium chitae]|uniref:Protein export protein SecD, putative n=1 Tax=Mycolicibacterium chitae TaxID=1792 RepID=A0A3S4S9Q3_MYCCI|nr:hypothetical protein [Mycolicibacterium chitae]MCV7105796.1 hypothetical protein [Mycolicibacterium chitae]BBZ04640.1 hypothetical protein MCHIJ_40770 [Mycolicibacterium chitae]VEG48270.1 protein export protein SecD, putative [Mycolicibacterium chitae]
MTDPSGRDAARRRRRAWIAGLTAVLGFTLIVPMAVALVSSAPEAPPETTAAAEPAPPPTTPVEVRPVVSVEGIAPEGCPPAGPATEPLQLCDLAKNGLYTLGSDAVQLQLVQVESLLSPITRGHFVQVMMTEDSARIFGDLTAAQVGKQLAFIRDGVVVSAPAISERIDGTVLQLTGEMSAEQSDEIARLLRDEA